MVKKIRPEERKNLNVKDKTNYIQRLTQLCNNYDINPAMGYLFLEEIKIAGKDDPKNKKCWQSAMHLDLL